MAFLFLLFGFLFGAGTHRPACPALREETKPVFKPIAYIQTSDGKRLNEESNGIFKNMFVATVTIDSFGIEQVQTGTKTDEEAVAFNKRVRECETANGQFDKP